MAFKAITPDTKIKEFAANPIGSDLIDTVCIQAGIDKKLVSTMGAFKLSAIPKLAKGAVDAAFIQSLCDVVNTYKDEELAPDIPQPEEKWWKQAVGYQIYPRSFKDSNGDGVGDLRGIIEKLDYLKELGINLLWLSPIYKSPNDDNGYDISDYRDIMDEFGTLEDFDELLNGAHERGIRLIMDLVVNHSSDENRWFEEARKSRDNPYHDYYIWREGKDGKLPNNWDSVFSGPAWEYNEATDEYYLHLFSKKQVDLNWDNPALRAEVYDMVNWWLDKGVDGFRLDVINFISKAEGLPDGSPLLGQIGGCTGMEHYAFGPNTHKYLHELNRKGFGERDTVSVGEMPGIGLNLARLFTSQEREELDMIFNFDILNCPGKTRFSDYKYDLNYMKEHYIKWQTGYSNLSWNSLFTDNHDNPRMLSRVIGKDGRYRAEAAKLIAVMQLTMKGTPFIYQGQELGAVNVPFDSMERIRDVESLNLYKKLKGTMKESELVAMVCSGTRDHARVPMQWTAGAQAGFTDGTPWIEVNPDYVECNVEDEQKDSASVLAFFKKLIALRKENPALVYGEFAPADGGKKNLFCYTRVYNGEEWYIELNLTDAPQRPPRDTSKYTRMLSNYERHGSALAPYEANIYKTK